MTSTQFKAWLTGYIEALRATPGYEYSNRRMYDESVIDRIEAEAEKIADTPLLLGWDYAPIAPPADPDNDCGCPAGIICNSTACPRAPKVTYL